MSNTINVNYMTRAYNQYQQKNAAKDQEKEDTRFADSVREKSEASGSIVGNSKIGSVSAKDMTMVEYKQYIYNKNISNSNAPHKSRRVNICYNFRGGF